MFAFILYHFLTFVNIICIFLLFIQIIFNFSYLKFNLIPFFSLFFQKVLTNSLYRYYNYTCRKTICQLYMQMWRNLLRLFERTWVTMSVCVAKTVYQFNTCRCGGTGRRTGLKILRANNPCRFDSGHLHQKIKSSHQTITKKSTVKGWFFCCLYIVKGRMVWYD